MGREQLKKLADDTVKISKEKHYFKNGKKINFNTKNIFCMYEKDDINIGNVKKNDSCRCW